MSSPVEKLSVGEPMRSRKSDRVLRLEDLREVGDSVDFRFRSLTHAAGIRRSAYDVASKLRRKYSCRRIDDLGVVRVTFVDVVTRRARWAR